MSNVIHEKVDVVVIGAGPGGEKGAAQAAYFGKKVAIIEKAKYPGGACSNTGTIPSKTFRETALHLSGLAARGITGVAIDLNENVTAKQVLADKARQVIKVEHGRIMRNINKHHITYINGRAEFFDLHTLHVFDRENKHTHIVTSEFIMVATGSSPFHPKEIPFNLESVWDSDTVLQIKSIPKSITILGAGVIGAEYACIFAALGVDVKLLDNRDRILPFVDHEIGENLHQEMEKLGVKIFLNEKATQYDQKENSIVVHTESGKKIESQGFLFASGRNGNTQGLKLEKVGITPGKRGELFVNENYQVIGFEHIYAIGDVIGFPALASTSMEQGRLAMCHALGLMYREQMTEHLPMGIYTIPEVSSIGETEEALKEKRVDYEVGRYYFIDNPRAQIMGSPGGMIKILFHAKTQDLLGIHIVCERASEIIMPGVFAKRMGVKLDFFINTVFNYPTLSEAYKYAAYDGLGRLVERNHPSRK